MKDLPTISILYMTQTEATYHHSPQCSMPSTILDRYELAPQKRIRAERLKKQGRDPARCGAASTHIINGKPYCRRHAGEVSLRILTMLQAEYGDDHD